MQRIAVDTLGGDDNSVAAINAAMRYAKDHSDVFLHLVGDNAQIWEVIGKRPKWKWWWKQPNNVRVDHAPISVRMDGAASSVLRCDPQVSVVKAAELVDNGTVSGAVSVGNSGACMVAARRKIGCLPGIDRPAIALEWPTTSGRPIVLLDAGANVDCTTKQLIQFTELGVLYSHRVLKVPSPRIRLLSIGEENGKGNKQVKAAAEALSEHFPNQFLGNIEGKCLSHNPDADVVVCDGFIGNVVLKTGEGSVRLALESTLKYVQARWYLWPFLAFLPFILKAAGRSLKYEAFGAAPLLGIDGIFFIGHGCSNEAAFYRAIESVHRALECDLIDLLRAAFQTEEVAK